LVFKNIFFWYYWFQLINGIQFEHISSLKSWILELNWISKRFYFIWF